MAGFIPIIPTLVSTSFQLANSQSRGPEFDRLERQLSEKNQADRRRANAQTQYDRRTRQQALDGALAKNRAILAARGVYAPQGSSHAVLRSMVEDSDQKAQESETLEYLRQDDRHRGYRYNLLNLNARRDQNRLNTLNSIFSLSSPIFDPDGRSNKRSLI